MEKYWNIFTSTYTGYPRYLWGEICNPSINSYFYWFLLVSFFFFLLEVIVPWRKKQKILRKDFWLDAFFMFFNLFIFSMIIYQSASDVVVNLLNDGVKYLFNGFDLSKTNPMRNWPLWAILITGFIIRDFIQWWIHRLLHKVERLWNFHKVHHSVEEMGFAAHLRFHWMETIVYRTLEYLPLALLGIGLHDFFVIHLFTLAWGHYNHSNISIDGRITGTIIGFLIGIVLANNLLDTSVVHHFGYNSRYIIFGLSILAGGTILGPVMKYLFNSPEMHLWHHAYELPEERRTGVNFGLTLAIWDFIFGTVHQPHNEGDIRLGFPGIEEFPENFIKLNSSGFK